MTPEGQVAFAVVLGFAVGVAVGSLMSEYYHRKEK